MKNVTLICGGKSPEHEISVRSAKNILRAIDRSLFRVTLVGIDRQGRWRLQEESQLGKFVPAEGPQLALAPGNETGQVIRLDNQQPIEQPEVIFLILHGPQGEDGTIQGLLRILGLPFVGPDVLGSSVAMDKDLAKRVLREAGLNVARGVVAYAHQRDTLDYGQLTEQLGSPIFVKPANMGSSVGVHKVKTKDQFDAAIADAFQYDTKVIIEEMIHGRELECAVLGNEYPKASKVGEVVTAEEYSFDAKYESPDAAKLMIPAEVSEDELERLRTTAIRAYQALNCEVLSRVDMFLTARGKVYVNEVNTLPGFTNISMYPALWEEAGVSYTELITRLIHLAISRHEARKALKTSWRE
ncbi:MAG: D-alanine--D-alanine ligase [Phaeodactylibacter sp.]|nr:D-alanine--D-alanine ligase [Phaeodactylibacter sp.]MCB9294891.1 D-alanine--D-alanine ligase [Lewinellaceae bacterium]